MSTTRARKLRRNPTDAEIRLWARLRRNQIDGYHFKRQVSIGGYVVDFACVARRLVIEVDGGQHADCQRFDAARTAVIEKFGYRVMRFWNSDVLANTDGVVETIRNALRRV